MKVVCKKSITSSNYVDQVFHFKKGEMYNARIDVTIYGIYDKDGVLEFFTKDQNKSFDIQFSDYFYTPEELRQLKLQSL